MKTDLDTLKVLTMSGRLRAYELVEVENAIREITDLRAAVEKGNSEIERVTRDLHAYGEQYGF